MKIAADAPPTKEKRRRTGELTLLRPLPGPTPLHRLWAGTKLVTVAALAVLVSFRPTWPSIGAAGGLVALAWVAARIPRGALPRVPRWFFVGFALGAFLTLRSPAQPVGRVLGVAVSWGGLEEWARITALALTVFAAAAVMSWTTPLAEVAPALARLGAPLRRLRVPVDEWAASIALSVRCLPLLIEEVRTLVAARRLRPGTRQPGELRMTWALREGQDLLFTSLAVSLRRATELGQAIEARGGFGTVSDATTGLGWRDAVVAALLVAVVALGVLL